MKAVLLAIVGLALTIYGLVFLEYGVTHSNSTHWTRGLVVTAIVLVVGLGVLMGAYRAKRR